MFKMGFMPFCQTTVEMSRFEFVSLASQPGANVRQLCDHFQISPTTGYKWIQRHREDPVGGLKDRSRRPLSSPWHCSAEVEDAVMELHREYPFWGARKLRQLIPTHLLAPAASTIQRIIERHGSKIRSNHQQRGPFVRFERPAPNCLWQMDYKGDIALGKGGRCYPLSVEDDHSRYSLTLSALGTVRRGPTQEVLRSCFQRYGLPEAILCDNGPPWGNSDPGSVYTGLGVWLLQLGVDLIHSRPYHPQTQGKCERLNRTIELEVLGRTLPWRDLGECQEHFEHWRHRYNHLRPHEALGMKSPASCYEHSRRSMPQQALKEEYLETDVVRKVKSKGEITFANKFYYVGRAFIGLPIGIRPTITEGVYDIYYSWKRLGSIDLKKAGKAKYRYHPIIKEEGPME